ncbi:hypothetical protein COU78_05080 [Candidatus Peregrinibacteria bacterium CG10_big_fil_rev_8_21_14_0_10_49_24]|nr:MAG: hypothetical protein COV83_01450 [Candidatus Peregrinibacteria bacterium CG11_big_fil_rev_8_21_14_0_20_49_14]PIR50721.1 MAG: hypothetical protein COU78_05080 [Candidatus Peregrinibacteria bacterium CG10_big_fil_rev_8_21_14_0_10_49_24]PJA68235.1 MAG: hypothetical protein CO157_00730 [Candidatus Peregrinibacteria bacterium CG_4_9_14_3_um_filter_49_12]
MSSYRSHHRQLVARSISAAMLTGMLSAPLGALAATPDAMLYFRPHCELQSEDRDTILGPVPDVEELVSLGSDNCPAFEVEDPQTLKTSPMRAGDVLNFDVAVRNPSKQTINHVRSWLAYDPNVFEGIRIEVSSNFPMVTPGESDFDHANGYAMIEASNDAEGVNQAGYLAVARVQLRAKIAPESGTFISFYDVQRGGHSAVTAKENGNDEYIVGEEPGGLHVLFAESPGQQNSNEPPPPPQQNTSAENLLGNGEKEQPAQNPPPQDAPRELSWDGGACLEDADCWTFNCVEGICVDPASQPQSEDPNASPVNQQNESNTDVENQNNDGNNAEIPGLLDDSGSQPPTDTTDDNQTMEKPPAPEDRTPFSLLQVRNVRTTTEGSSILLAWDKLNSSSLKAYNIYYGTTTGRYIQRKTVDKELNSLILRALPVGTTYYIAVRAANAQDEESAFSQEVAVEVGNPGSSTAPLVENQVIVAPGVPNELIPEVNGQQVVPGETGTSSTIALLFILCAGMGTLLASRRQLIAIHNPSSLHE